MFHGIAVLQKAVTFTERHVARLYPANQFQTWGDYDI